MAQILDLGKIRFNWAGTYDSDTEYEYNDLVKYGPNLYAYTATNAAAGIVPTDTASWVTVVEGIEFKGTYAASTLYYVNDIVTDGTSTFIVTAEHTSSPTPSSASNSNLTLIALGQEGLPNLSGNIYKLLSNNGTEANWTDIARLTKVYSGTTQGTAASDFETSAALTDTAAVFAKSTTNFGQVALVNPSNGMNASADLIIYTADGDNGSGWIDMGITSNNFDAATYGITGPHDGYIFMSAPRGAVKEISQARVIGTVATLTTTTAHGFSVGNVIKLEGVDAGGGTGILDGLVTLTAVSATTFSFNTDVTPFAEKALSPFAVTYKPKGNGNIVLATDKTGLENAIIFAAGGFVDGLTQMAIYPEDKVEITINTDSTSPSTGAFIVDGGAGIGKSLHIAEQLHALGKAYVGSAATAFEEAANLTDAGMVVHIDGESDFGQVAVHNGNSAASTDIIAYAADGSDNFGWMDMGVTGNRYSEALYTITGPSDAYIFYEAEEKVVKTITNKALTANVATITTSTPHGFLVGNAVTVAGVSINFDGHYIITAVPSPTTFSYNKVATDIASTASGGTATKQGKGNLVFATGSQGSENAILFGAGGFDSGQTQMAIYPGRNVHIDIDTPSTSPTTGALTVIGGVGIQGDVNIAGNITFGGEGTQISTANLAVSAPLIFTGDGSVSTTNDLGIVTEGKYLVTNIPASTIVNKVLSANVATLTTKTAHNLAVGDTVTIAGVDATFNGTYAVATVPSSTTFTYSKTASPVTSARIGDVTYSISQKVLVSNVATLTTTVTHDLLVGETIEVTGVDATFNGTYVISGVTGTTFSYAKTNANVNSAAVSPVGTVTVNRSTATSTVVTATRTRWAAWTKDATDNKWKLVSNISTKPTTEINYSQNTYGTGVDIAYDAIKVQAVETVAALVVGGSSSVVGTENVGGDFSVNTNKFNVTAASGNTAIAGTLAVTGNTTMTGTLSVNGGTITSSAATVALLNATPTTINFGGAATTISIGAATGTTTVNNSLAVTGGLTVNTNKFTVAAATGNTLVGGTLDVTGATTLNNTLAVTGNATFSGNVTITGALKFQEITEDVIDTALASNAATLDYNAGNIFWLTSAPSAAMTWNVTNAPTVDGKVFTVTGFVTQGSTGYVPTTLTVNGAGATIKWVSGTTPSATSGTGKIDIFNFTLIRRGGAWTALGAATTNF